MLFIVFFVFLVTIKLILFLFVYIAVSVYLNNICVFKNLVAEFLHQVLSISYAAYYTVDRVFFVSRLEFKFLVIGCLTTFGSIIDHTDEKMVRSIKYSFVKKCRLQFLRKCCTDFHAWWW